MNRLIYTAWDGSPPRIQAISFPMPGSPYIPLTGGCTTRIPLDKFLQELERDLKKQTGHYYAYVWGYSESEDESDIYTLQTWQVCPPDDGTYESIVVLYYAPINPYLTIKKHFGDHSAQEYLTRNAAISAISNALT